MNTKLWRRKTLWIIIFILCCVGTNNITSQSADAAGAANTTKNVYTTSQINSIQSLAQKNYTVLIYMIGSDLESENSAASNDIAEITTALQQSAGKISDYANIVVEYGGSTKWHNPILKNADSLHGRFELTKNGIENLTTLQPKSMGDPDTLQAFLSFGITRYPADNYILIFWDHGDGPVLGYGCDALYKDDSLTMEEIEQSFKQSGMEQYHFPIIGFDACLMGGIETAYTMPKNVDYLVASAEPEPIDGWNYAWLSVLANPKATGKTIGISIVDAYMEQNNVQPLTMGVFDCHAANILGNNFSDKVRQTCKNEGRLHFLQRISSERMDYYGYDKFGSSYVSEIVDLTCFARSIYTKKEELEQFERLYQNTVLYAKTANVPDTARGISIYLPSGTNMFLKEDKAVYQTVPFPQNYRDFVKKYAAYLLKEPDLDIKTGQFTWDGDRLYFSPDNMNCFAKISGLAFLYDEEREIYQLIAEINKLNKTPQNVSFTKSTECLLMNGVPLFGYLKEQNEDFTEYLCPILNGDTPGHLQVRFYENSDTEAKADFCLLNDSMDRIEGTDWQTNSAITPLYPAFVPNGDILENACTVRGSITINGTAYQKGNIVVLSNSNQLNITMDTIAGENLHYGYHLIDININEYYYIK